MSGRFDIPALALAAALVAAAPPYACKPQKPVRERPPETTQEAAPKHAGGSGTVAARVGDMEITVDDVKRYIDSLPVFVRLRYQTPEGRRKFLEALVEYKALALEAQRLGYARDPRLLHALKSDAAARLLLDEVDSKVTSRDIDERDVRRYYETHPWEFHHPRQVSVRHVLVKDVRTARKVAYKARKLCAIAGLDPREEFTKLVRKYSVDDRTRASGGDIGRFPRVGPGGPPVPDEVARAAASLTRQFEISDPVQAPDGFHVLFAWEVHPPLDRTLDQARESIVKKLVEQVRERRRREYVHKLVSEARIEVDEKALESVIEAKTGGKAGKDARVQGRGRGAGRGGNP